MTALSHLRRIRCEAVALTFAWAAATASGKGSVEWSGIEPHPAVVDPVCGYEPGAVVDLAGEWTFARIKHQAPGSRHSLWYNTRHATATA